MNLWFAWHHGTDLGHYERLGTQTFNNLRIDIGTEADRRFLAGGWGDPESDGSRPFRWSLGDESLLLAPLRQRAPYTLRIEAQPFRRPEGAPQTLTIELNGTVVAEASMQSGFGTYEIALEPAQLRAGVNDLRFRYGFATSPRDLGLSDDPRPLAVRFLRVELLRRE